MLSKQYLRKICCPLVCWPMSNTGSLEVQKAPTCGNYGFPVDKRFHMANFQLCTYITEHKCIRALQTSTPIYI